MILFTQSLLTAGDQRWRQETASTAQPTSCFSISITTDAAPTHLSDLSSTLFQLSSGLQVFNVILAASCLGVNQPQSLFDEGKRTASSKKLSTFIPYKLWRADVVVQRSEFTNSYSNISSAARTEVHDLPYSWRRPEHLQTVQTLTDHPGLSQCWTFGPVFCSPVHPGSLLGGWQWWSTWSWTILYVSLSVLWGVVLLCWVHQRLHLFQQITISSAELGSEDSEQVLARARGRPGQGRL